MTDEERNEVAEALWSEKGVHEVAKKQGKSYHTFQLDVAREFLSMQRVWVLIDKDGKVILPNSIKGKLSN